MQQHMQHILIEKSEENLETLTRSLAKTLSTSSVRIDAQDKENISSAIRRTQFPFSVHNFLFYINLEIANLLACSSHPLLREWGNKCKSFYASDLLNKHVQPETGLVVVKQGKIHTDFGMFTFLGQGVWNLLTNSWVPAPGSACPDTSGSMLWSNFNLALFGGDVSRNGRHVEILPIKPADLSKFPIELISPMHVAGLIGDKDLMQYLIAQGSSLEDDHNKWRVTPLEMVIMSEQTEVIDFMFQKNIAKDKALKLAVEKSSFPIIEKIVNLNAPITDEIIEAARARNRNLYSYLELRRKADMQQRITSEGPFNALQSILNYSKIPFQSVVDLICEYPNVINAVANESSGNTLLHQLVLEKNAEKVKALMGAILDAKLLPKGKGLLFDIEKKNKTNQTALNLALAGQNKDVISAVMQFGNPSYTSLESQIAQANINIPEILRERVKQDQQVREKISHLLLETSRSEMETNINVGILAVQQKQMATRLNALTEEVKVQKQQNAGIMEIVEALLIEVQESRRENAELRALLQEHRPGMALPAPTSTTKQPRALNRNHLFAITNSTEVSPLQRQQSGQQPLLQRITKD